jgi:hypothetical protein
MTGGKYRMHLGKEREKARGRCGGCDTRGQSVYDNCQHYDTLESNALLFRR